MSGMKFVLSAIAAAFFVSAAVAQPAEKVALTRAGGPITIDGRLDDAGWKTAARFENWYETNPGDNIEPKAKTVGYVTYDDHFFYVALDMSDPDPSKIAAPYGDHDQINGNSQDFAGVILDTRNDGKTGQELFVNAHGVQFDAVNDDASGNEDASPDLFWDSATKIDSHGWSLEMRIPFSSLRYDSRSPEQWGIILYRNWPRERRYQMFTSKLPRGGNCLVCRFAKLTGLRDLPSGDHIVAAPYVTASRIGEAETLGSPLVKQPLGSQAGLDVKWVPNADSAVDATINPDFSQIESDVAAISTNERFAIFYPEKRPFFLEGVELFNTPIQAVYTRTITSPRWGTRATGRRGAISYTALVSQDRGGGVIVLPSPVGSDFANQEFSSTVLIGRLRRDFGRNYIGLLGTAREMQGSSHNRVLGPDFQFWIGEKNTIAGQLLFSDTVTPNRPELAAEWDGRRLRSYGGDVRYTFSNPRVDVFVEQKDFGSDFRADAGFVPQVGYRSTYAETGYTVHPEKSFFSRIRTYAFGEYDSQNGDYDGVPDGAQLYRLASVGFGADGRYRSFTRLRYAREGVRSGSEVLDQDRIYYTVQFSPSTKVTQVSLDGYAGDSVDFSNSRLGRGASVGLNGTLQPTDHLTLSLTNAVRWLSISGDRLFTSQVERVRATYTFNSRMFVRAIVQNQRTNRDIELYGGGVDQHSGSVSSQLLLAYKLNWQTVMFLGYGDLREVTTADGDFVPSNRQFFAKFSYAFQR